MRCNPLHQTNLVCIALLLLFGVTLSGCLPDFDASDKNRCEGHSDCLTGYLCIAGVCQEADSSQVDLSTDVPMGDADSTDAPDEDITTDQPDSSDESDDAEMDVVVGPDADGDGVADMVDNCVDTRNPAQEDYDNNGVGDVCQTNEHTTLLISEIMADPEEGISFTVREWQRQYIELYNAGEATISLAGWKIELASGAEIQLPDNENLSVAAGEHFVISGGPLSDDVHDYTHASSGFRIAKGETADGQNPYEVIRLIHPLVDDDQRRAFVADEVRLLEPVPRGTSLEFEQASADDVLPALKNNDVNRWCGAWFARGEGRDGGSPGADNGPCNEPELLQCSTSGGPPKLPLDQHVFGDLSDPVVTHANVNRCPSVESQAALSADLTYTVEVAEQTAVGVTFHPLPNIEGDQNSGMVSVEPWLGMVYWREDECPTDIVTLPGPSVCLAPSDEPVTSNILLDPNITYYFTIDGQRRSLGGAYEEGRFTFALIRQ